MSDLATGILATPVTSLSPSLSRTHFPYSLLSTAWCRPAVLGQAPFCVTPRRTVKPGPIGVSTRSPCAAVSHSCLPLLQDLPTPYHRLEVLPQEKSSYFIVVIISLIIEYQAVLQQSLQSPWSPIDAAIVLRCGSSLWQRSF